MASPSDPNSPRLPQVASDVDDASAAVPPKRPPTPPSRPVRPPPIARPEDPNSPFASLPELPKMAASTPKRDLTLVGLLQNDASKNRRGVRNILGGIAVLVFVSIISSILYRHTLVTYFVPKHKTRPAAPLAVVEPVLTAQQRAARALAAGSEAYGHRDYGKAVASFEEALNLDASLADAHRSLGIVHADLHDEAEAIAHYQKYIEMVPHGRDSAHVKKIIDDYQLAHAPPEAPPAPVKGSPKNRRLGRAHVH